MPKGTCSVTDCDRPHRSRGWCHAHYMFWYKNRVEPTGQIQPWGQCRTDECSVDGCDSRVRSLGMCAPHYKRLAKDGDPGPTAIRPRVIPDDDGSYRLVHNRLKQRRGSAAKHSCVTCESPAKHWAYDHRDPNERTSAQGYAFSVNLDHYRPMCPSCHKRFDLARRNGTPLEAFYAC